ncbi:EF-P lysine aminoacylase GenX [Terasakiispira papahanaumokuakeensis]|uniref:EF-P lysine aminoacylase GenX n=1 Tax=Terasakiispira papahanaumokuakeensis TaxID=197479 RepID=A0A1E2V636_9GAMM|nr:EF-P lysine aminoacylase EpmA [Terasakiispira papahanaumokuakeensis]ODC02444.1 EF-P lysine aminoacylase GenX [Terasakiispira papahanaumokuakeensis]
MSWRPSASLEQLRFRAQCIQQVRTFFEQRDVLEVETPILGSAGSTDPFLDSFITELTPAGRPSAKGERLWLQTSPECHMKRLLAAGYGAIWQLSRCFRNGERSRRHNPEFSMIEWYRPGWNLGELLGEIQALINLLLGKAPYQCMTYSEALQHFAHVDPFTATDEVLRDQARACSGLDGPLSRDDCLDILISHRVEPALATAGRVCLTEFPASQAALARTFTNAEGHLVAERCEVYVAGIELANAYHELTDAHEQAQRFMADCDARQQLGKPDVQADEALLEALNSGLPSTSGVALGLDRLIMLAAGASSLDEVTAFPIDRA